MSMSTQMALSLHTLPVELVYRILDNLDDKSMFLSSYNVCTRINTIIHTYHRYQVIFVFIMKSYPHHLGSMLSFSKKHIYFDYFSCSWFQRDRFHTTAFYTSLYPINGNKLERYSYALLEISWAFQRISQSLRPVAYRGIFE